MPSHFLCHYHEVGLKKKNRPFFENRLRRNIQTALGDFPFRSVRRISGRLIVELMPHSPIEEMGRRLQKVFGLSFCAPAWVSSQELNLLQENLWKLVQHRSFDSFKIQARRAHKNFPWTSPQLNERLGAYILEKSGKRVQLDYPALTCHVDLVENYAFLYFEKLTGAGGLPTSTAGKAVVLLSGGIDSPVAAYRIMKRGCRAIFAHFHSYPHTTLESQEKVRHLVQILTQYQFRSTLYLIPFAECQRRIVATTPPEIRIILYRRLMIRLAERIAQCERAQILVTGDSIGQVASQTLENLSAINRVAQLPIFRPLSGDDKKDIIDTARKIETFEVSILPDLDCCSLFVPRHPVTKANVESIERVEQHLDLQEMIESTFKQRKMERIEFLNRMPN